MNRQEALILFQQSLREGLQLNPPFKGYGFKFMEFVLLQPEAFKTIFKEGCQYDNMNELFFKDLLVDELLPIIIQTFSISQEQALYLYKKAFFYTLGYAMLIVDHPVLYCEEEYLKEIGDIVRATMILIHSSDDPRSSLKPGHEMIFNDQLDTYLKHVSIDPRFSIIGIGNDKTMYKVYIEDILYFEAVGELVFAYTKESVFEIKKRLYQIEEELKIYGFERISKSIVVNLEQINAIHPGINRCFIAIMSNDEQIVISRNYAKEVMNITKTKWGK